MLYVDSQKKETKKSQVREHTNLEDRQTIRPKRPYIVVKTYLTNEIQNLYIQELLELLLKPLLDGVDQQVRYRTLYVLVLMVRTIWTLSVTVGVTLLH